ncbi:hypothetical protein [Polyangium mundeleinium]|uniref:Lipoprotein n=1 Tax=Polyangium mundeleinium TaxID=2995306 RepID=A0ABT5F1Y2_9BACT|nr:hypothetical protein [Polyangium mundeleinium]MDC0747609.1 hypothetical protein [Polyangium mundeleinium]
MSICPRGKTVCLSATLLLAMAGCSSPLRPPKPAAPPSAPAAPEQHVHVRIDADQPAATLVEERRDQDVPACAAPCDRVIPVRKGARFHVEALGARPTSSFELFSPQDPVVWLDVKTTSQATYDTLYRIFLGTMITGGALMLTGVIGVPLAEEKGAQTALSAVGFTGLVLLLPISGILGGISAAHSTSNVTFKDPRTRPDLRERIR